KVTAANLRLPSALYAIAGALLAMLFAYEILGRDAAVLAGLALAGSYQYVSQGRFGRVDMTLCFFESLALFAFLWWLPREPGSAGRRARLESNLPALYLMAAALGLGVLAKGPVGAILPGVSILIFMIAEHRGRQILLMLDPGAIIVGGAIASSWYLACYFGGRFAFLNRQLDTENVGRFFGALGAMAPWYYLKPVLLNSAPLSLIVPIAAVWALLTPLLTERHEDSTSSSANAGAIPSDPARSRSAVRLFAIFYFATVIFFYIPRMEVRTCRDDSFRPAAEEIARVVAPTDPLYLYGFQEEAAPLLFYLDRDAPVLPGRLGDAPPGFVIMPANVWKTHQSDALDFEPVLTSDHGNRHLVIVKRGKSYASSPRHFFARVTAPYLSQSTR